MDNKYSFDGLTLPADFVQEWVPIVGYSSFYLALAALLIYGVFALIVNVDLNISENKHHEFLYNFEEYNFRYKAYLIGLIILSILSIFIMFIVASVMQSQGEGQHSNILKQWLIEEHNITIEDPEMLEILLNSTNTSEEDTKNSTIFLKHYGTLNLIPSENNTYYLAVNGEIVIPE